MAALSQVLAQIRQRESTNNYSLTPAQNVDFPRSHASGAYQFQPATWQQYTRQSGIGTQYAEAYQAPPNIQDAVAAYAATNGPGVNSSALWGASAPQGGYPLVTQLDTSPQALAGGGQIAQGPQTDSSGATVLPEIVVTPDNQQSGNLGTGGQVTGGTGSGSSAGNASGLTGGMDLGIMGAGQPGFVPPASTGGPSAFGLVPGLAAGINSWITGAETAVGTAFKNAYSATLGSVQNLAIRFFLILTGIVILALALWKLLNPDLSAKDIAALATKVPV